MARDVRMYGDEQIDYWLSQPNTPPELRAELMAEKQRRANPAPPNVEANLEASAAPIAPDPVVGGRRRQVVTDEQILQGRFGPGGVPTEAPADFKVPADELDEYGERFRGAIARRIDAGFAARQAARAAGYQDPEQIAYNEATGVTYASVPQGPMQGPSPMDPNDPSTWEAGYEDYVQRNTPAEPTNSVERVDRYFADKNRAPLQSKEDFMADQSQAYTRRQAAKNQEQYGYGLPADQVTAPQRQRRAELIDDENKQRAGQIDLVIGRLAAQYGVPNADVAAALKPYMDDNSLTPKEIREATAGFRYAHRDKQNAELADRRAFLRRRGMMAGSNARANAANNFTDMPDDWQNFVRAGGKGATPLDVEARQLQQAAAWAGQAVTGALANGGQNGIVGEQWAAKRRGDAVARARELAAERGNKLTVADRDRIARQVEAEFPGHGQAAVDALDVQEPLPLPEGHGNPGRVPEGHG
jgi:hypothetical protein